MLSICFSTRKENNEFKKHLIDNCGVNDIEIIEYINDNQFSLTHLYNKFISESKYDICVCLHDDVILEKGWGRKLLNDFSKSDASIIGKAGTVEMSHSGVYWEKMSTDMVGHVYHQIDGNPKYLSTYSNKFNQLIEVVSIDGLFISFDKTKIKHKFDEYFSGFHFYDHSFCLPNFIDGCKIYVTFSFDITHKSAGETNEAFEKSRLKFVKKYNNQLPLKANTHFYVENKNPIIKKEKQKLVSIIIPHIHKNNLLFGCIDTLYKSTTYENFEIVIADTGSNNETLSAIEDFIKKYSNIKLVKYDYYNFAKINNDVVKNHINSNTDFILFLNNDVEFIENNDVLSRLVQNMLDKPTCASCGPRMYFGINKPIQHGGMFAYVSQRNSFEITHHAINCYYTYYKQNKDVFGNTGACLLIRHNVFYKIGMFNESYTECFEDVELCAKTIILGYKNIHVSDAVCIHKESQTRNDSDEKLKKLKLDYTKNLAPFIQANFEKLKPYIHNIK